VNLKVLVPADAEEGVAVDRQTIDLASYGTADP
jgi:hypothetical protein